MQSMDSTTKPTVAPSQESEQKPAKKRTLWGVIRGFWHTFVSFGNLLLLLLFVGSLLSRYISPTTMTLFPYLGLLFPLLFALVVLQAIYWFIIRAWSRAAINTVMLLISLPTLLLYAPIRVRQTPPIDRENWIKVLSLNANAFQFSKLGPKEQHPTTDYLAKSDADIICLQEAWLSSNKSKYMSERSLHHSLKEYPYYSSAYAVKDHGSRLIVLSKYPILSTRPIDLHSKFNGGAVFTILVGEKKLILYNLHLESFGFTKEEQKHYFQLAQEVNPKGFTQAVGGRFSPAFKRRAKQVEQVYQDINYQESPYLLVCGDFNDTPISYTHHRLSMGLHDAIASTGRGVNYSYYFKSLIGVRIDHMLYSDQIEARAAYVDRTAEISDHKPIICYFKLK